jgi:bifunctional non-homologous end joining protein LigD
MRPELEGERVRLITRGGYDWARRYPSIVEAVRKNRQSRFVIDGEVTIRGVDGVADFSALHSRKQDYVVQLYAFNIMALDGRLPLSIRKTNLDRLLRGHLQKFDGVIARGERHATATPRHQTESAL